MSALTLDTSGQVPTHGLSGALALCWGSLDAFTQGYIEALLNGSAHDLTAEGDAKGHTYRDAWGFADLAPETLERIVSDCAKVLAASGVASASTNETEGRNFWALRKGGFYAAAGLPPLTPYLGDDGKVYVREA